MSITLYSKYRRIKYRHAWRLAGMTDFVYRCLVISALVIAAMVTRALIANYFDNHDAKQAALKEVSRLENVILSCLNSGAMGINGELHLCRPANTWVQL